jgi:hypothetical protein
MSDERARSAAAYERVSDQIFPGTLALLTRRIAVIPERDCKDYQGDIEAVLAWLELFAQKEAVHTGSGTSLPIGNPVVTPGGGGIRKAPERGVRRLLKSAKH